MRVERVRCRCPAGGLHGAAAGSGHGAESGGKHGSAPAGPAAGGEAGAFQSGHGVLFVLSGVRGGLGIAVLKSGFVLLTRGATAGALSLAGGVLSLCAMAAARRLFAGRYFPVEHGRGGFPQHRPALRGGGPFEKRRSLLLFTGSACRRRLSWDGRRRRFSGR